MNKQGFSLLELQISLVFFTVLFGVAFTATTTGSNFVVSAVQRGDANTQMLRITGALDSELSGANILVIYDQDEDYAEPKTGRPSIGSMIVYQTPVATNMSTEDLVDEQGEMTWGAGDWAGYAWRIAFIPDDTPAHPGGLYNEIAERTDLNGDGFIEDLTFCIGKLRKDMFHALRKELTPKQQAQVMMLMRRLKRRHMRHKMRRQRGGGGDTAPFAPPGREL